MMILETFRVRLRRRCDGIYGRQLPFGEGWRFPYHYILWLARPR